MKSVLALAVTVLILLDSSAGQAGSVIVHLTDGGGNPVPDAVVKLTTTTPIAETLSHQSHFIDQLNETFFPYVSLISIGDDVIFRNSDQTRHHVYSFSPLALFEYILKPDEKSPPIFFIKPGVIAVGCNIHDQMITYIYVSETPLAAVTDAQGRGEIKNVPDGPYVAHFWHPKLRPGRPEPTQTVDVGDSPATLSSVLPLLPGRPKTSDDHRLY